MRTLNIEMSKAAKDRLNLLKDPDTLPLPLDTESLGPFGFRFGKDVMILTYGDRDVAYVPDAMNEDKKSFNLLTPMRPNDTVDAALKRVLSTLTAHLDRVGTIINAQKREIAAQERARREANDQDHLARTAETIQIVSDLWVSDETAWTARIDPHDLLLASRTKGPEDILMVSTSMHNRAVMIGVSPRLPIELLGAGEQHVFRTTRDPFAHALEPLKDAATAFEAEGRKPDMRKIRDEIQRMSDRTIRVNEMDVLTNTFARLPAQDYSVEAYLLNTPAKVNTVQVDLDHDISLTVSRNTIKIYREGVNLRTLTLNANTLATRGSQDFLDRRSKESLPMDDETRHKLVAYAISTLADANPDVDFEVFKAMDPDILADAELNAEAGYQF